MVERQAQGRPSVTPRLELRGIRKAYPAVVANDDIDLGVAPGEIHAVIGENGAGKSTLMKIIYGMVQPDAGDMLWDGREVQSVAGGSPAARHRHGVPAFCPVRYAHRGGKHRARDAGRAVDRGTVEEDLAVAQRYGLPVDPGRHIYSMSVGERQRVEIIRALLQNPGLLIMDEPTSVLTPQAVEKLFVTLAPARRRGLQHPLHQPQARRDQQLCDERDGAARWEGDGPAIRGAKAPPRWRA